MHPIAEIPRKNGGISIATAYLNQQVLEEGFFFIKDPYRPVVRSDPKWSEGEGVSSRVPLTVNVLGDRTMWPK